MKRYNAGLISSDTPLIFRDGTEVYNKLAKEYITHKRGYFILAPSGAGKTYFVNKQREKDWIDGDYLWEATYAHPSEEWWKEPVAVINEVDQKSDIVTVQAKKLGFWIMGASNYWLQPDAIVIPDWELHKKYIIQRMGGNYDGGATPERFDAVLNHRNWILKWAKKGVPQFDSVQEAVRHCQSDYSSSV